MDKTANRLHTEDEVRVDLYLNGEKVGSYKGNGFHTVEQAVETAFDSPQLPNRNIEDYVFRVTDASDGTSSRYRVNAGGNIKLIPDPLP